MTEIQEQGFNQSNDGYTTASVISIRLDTAPILDTIEAYLRGKIIKGWQETDKGMQPVYGGQGIPLANDEGVQGILSFITPILSPITVQGNSTREEFVQFVIDVEIDLIEHIMTNLHNWEIRPENFKGIVRTIANTAQMFFSRTIDNKERESYSSSLRTTESVKETGGAKWLPWKN